jgi:hypothetical protein
LIVTLFEVLLEPFDFSLQHTKNLFIMLILAV